MSALVQVLQAVCGALWLLEAAILAPGTWRLWRQRGDALDAGRIPVLIFALTQVGFSVRWFIWPHSLAGMGDAELIMWATLYLLSAGCAAFCVAAHLPANRKLR